MMLKAIMWGKLSYIQCIANLIAFTYIGKKDLQISHYFTKFFLINKSYTGSKISKWHCCNAVIMFWDQSDLYFKTLTYRPIINKWTSFSILTYCLLLLGYSVFTALLLLWENLVILQKQANFTNVYQWKKRPIASFHERKTQFPYLY